MIFINGVRFLKEVTHLLFCVEALIIRGWKCCFLPFGWSEDTSNVKNLTRMSSSCCIFRCASWSRMLVSSDFVANSLLNLGSIHSHILMAPLAHRDCHFKPFLRFWFEGNGELVIHNWCVPVVGSGEVVDPLNKALSRSWILAWNSMEIRYLDIFNFKVEGLSGLDWVVTISVFYYL